MMENPRYTISPEAIANGINDLLDEKEELQSRIDKAIEYIESNCNEFYVNEPHYRGYQIINIEPLLDILKGSDNRKNR